MVDISSASGFDTKKDQGETVPAPASARRPELDEEEMIEIAERVFVSIARQLSIRETCIKTLFNKPEYVTKIAFFDG